MQLINFILRESISWSAIHRRNDIEWFRKKKNFHQNKFEFHTKFTFKILDKPLRSSAAPSMIIRIIYLLHNLNFDYRLHVEMMMLSPPKRKKKTSKTGFLHHSIHCMSSINSQSNCIRIANAKWNCAKL